MLSLSERLRSYRYSLVKYILPYRRTVIVGIHAILVGLAYLLAFLVRFEFQLPADEWRELFHTLPFVVGFRLVIFAWFHLHEGLWRYVSIRDMVTILKAATLGSLAMAAYVLMFFRHGFPRSVLLLDWLLCIALIGGIRMGARSQKTEGKRRDSR